MPALKVSKKILIVGVGNVGIVGFVGLLLVATEWAPLTNAFITERRLEKVPYVLDSRLWLSAESKIGTTDATSSTTESEPENPFHLTPELLKISNAFASIGDDKLRYKQLLFMSNQLPVIDPSLQIPENKVPGCLSTVYVDATLSPRSSTDDGKQDRREVQFMGDSDGLLTKGLVALLVRGLSGNTAADIQKVNPAFIQAAGISTSLTPGRNNGFLNMLAVMKRKALELDDQQGQQSDSSSSTLLDKSQVSNYMSQVDEIDSNRPNYSAIVSALQMLKPTVLDLKDVSYQHAGHVEGGNGEESHFDLEIVADAFDGLNLVKRHKLVYMMLGDVMPRIHALQISAKTPAELQKQ